MGYPLVPNNTSVQGFAWTPLIEGNNILFGFHNVSSFRRMRPSNHISLTWRYLLVKISKRLSLSLFLLPVLAIFAVAFAAVDNDGDRPLGRFRRLTTITIPGGLAAFDISWVDSANARYYLADRGNATVTPVVPPRIDVIDTEHDQYLTSINLPIAANGLVAIPRAHELWAGMNDSTVEVIDTDTNAVKHVVSTGGTMRADELAYDPVDHIILIANDRDTPPFVSFISQQSDTVLKRLNYDGISAPQSTGGIEQPVWDGAAGRFYIAIPSTKSNANGEIDEIDPHDMTVTRSFPTTCKPAGLALIPVQHLMTSCGDLVDIASGNVLNTIRGVSSDEIWYNPGDERVYFANGANVNVVDTDVNLPITTLTVGQILVAPAVSQTTHSLAADSGNNHIFVPVTGVGVEVWTDSAQGGAGAGAVTGSFVRLGAIKR
jgi:DNA-binding beta-propeller fold protein YncE